MAPRQIMDGCTAAAHIAYALSDIATVYPITPVASMGETARKWAVDGRKNLMGQAMQVVEMESELGAAGATHGALSGGALASTFTSSQGLLLMIPNMFKISGELLPGVFHVGTRAIATHALSIFGDHQDVMACRSTGFAFLASASVQETMDLALVAHLSAIGGSIPVCHFFDGWRTSNELASIDVIDYQDIIRLVDWDKVRAFRARAMNPEHPDVRGTAQNSDVYFQNREASNRFYDVFPSIVAEQMRKVGDLTGRRYGLVDYEGAPDADMVIVAMGSACEVACETVAWLNDRGYRTGVVKVRLFRPFPADALLRAIPPTVRAVAVLDRTKEPGANGEPLYQDVATAMFEARRDVVVTGGRYGLGSKDFNPSMVKAVFDELRSVSPRRRFTVGITDDVTGLSLPVADRIDTSGCDMLQCQFYGMGSDGTVGATRQAAQIISECSDRHVQAYFSYSAKKSGGYTVSQLRVSPEPVRSEYMIETADYIGCNKDTYVRRFHVLDNIRSGGIFVLNSSWSADDMERELPARLKRRIASAGVKFYNVDAVGIASKVGLGVRINVIMETVFLKLTGIVPFDEAVTRLKALVSSAYMHEGGDVVRKNIAAIDMAADAIVQIDYPASWAGIDDNDQSEHPAPPFVSEVARRCMSLEGNTLPVSAFTPDGFVPSGTTAWEKRRIAVKVPRWNVDNCVECTECSLVCAHAAIRPVVMDDAEASEAPASFVSKPADGDPKLHGFRFRIQVYAEDCTGCGSCSAVCPGHALDMEPLASQLDEQIANLDFAVSSVTLKEELLPRYTVKGSQLRQPLLEFSGACAGCGETPYVKLLTQLFGERMVIANATGCSSIWGANFPSTAYCANKDGHGPAWANSLFEDNAEYGYGIALALEQRRSGLAADIAAIAGSDDAPSDVRAAAWAWLGAKDDYAGSAVAGRELVASLAKADRLRYGSVIGCADLLARKSVWAIGGDGWAFDIGFGGLDHVIASGCNINILVMDTECYSNTGGQMSKATPLGAVVKYAPDGKRTSKKDLGSMAMTYGDVYVASICLGADFQQAIDALVEAEAYEGPSLVIAYCPCINHGIRAGMGHAVLEEREAVRCGYWPLYRYNPDRKKSGQQPLVVDSQAPDGGLIGFINGEDRYADLRMVDPGDASVLQPRLDGECRDSYNALVREADASECG